MLDSLTQDARDTPKERAAFAQIRAAERDYAVQLRKIARAIGDQVKGISPTDPNAFDTLQRVLEMYSHIIRPWAVATARRMLADVERRDRRAWITYSRMMGTQLRHELLDTPLGDTYQQLMDQQVDLITSLPLEAAKRVHTLVTEKLFTGTRATEVAKQIMLTGEVTQARANLIARTETSRAATTVTQTRAQFIGSPGYIWRTARDYKVRPETGIPHFASLNTLAMGSHRKLEGTFHLWTDPPIADPTGIRAHPGSIWNCRCYPEPVIPNQF